MRVIDRLCKTDLEFIAFVAGRQAQKIGDVFTQSMAKIDPIYGERPIDNNAAENAIRPMVVGRKNWLFAATEKVRKPVLIFIAWLRLPKLIMLSQVFI